MKEHNLLSKENIPLMAPIEKCLKNSFEEMKFKDISTNKNYFALSLK